MSNFSRIGHDEFKKNHQAPPGLGEVFGLRRSGRRSPTAVMSVVLPGMNANSIQQVWQQHNHAIEIRSREFFEQRLNYLHQNPVRAGVVAETED